MKTVKISLNSIEKVKSFVNAITRFDVDFDLVSGRYVIDAKSIMGIFSLDLSKPIDLNIHANEEMDAILEVLKPYIDNGTLVVKSGQTEKEQCATLNWNLEEAQKRMENLISSVAYGPEDTPLVAVLCQNDALACGVANALLATGYDASNMPVITGQDCDKPAVKNIVRGYQSMSVFKDTRTLAAQVVKMVNSITKGETVEVNDTSTYNNGTGVIPSFLCEPVACTKDNYKELLIESGYYSEDDL